MHSSDVVYLYHEKQVAALCGQHCLNTLLQGPYFTEVDLAQIAQDLDAMEQSFMAESGMDTEAYKIWQKEASGNVAVDGMFSIQVLSRALENWNLSCTNLDSPDATASRAHPEEEEAFICNLQEHWLTIKQIAGSWYNFNSLYPAPEFLGTLYLTAFLGTLREQGYSIFVVKGPMPGTHPEAGSSDSPGRWFTPQQAKEATKGAVNARETGYLKAAVSSCMGKASEAGNMVTLRPNNGSRAWEGDQQQEGAGPSNGSFKDEDEELARAIAASLDNGAGRSGASAGPTTDFGHGADPELAAALAASMQESTPMQSREDEEADLAAARLAMLDPGPEPAAGPGTLDIALRLPNGDRLMRRFQASDRIRDILNFLKWKQVDVEGFRLTSFPRTALVDPQQTLQAAGISNMETLTLQKH